MFGVENDDTKDPIDSFQSISGIEDIVSFWKKKKKKRLLKN